MKFTPKLFKTDGSVEYNGQRLYEEINKSIDKNYNVLYGNISSDLSDVRSYRWAYLDVSPLDR